MMKQPSQKNIFHYCVFCLNFQIDLEDVGVEKVIQVVSSGDLTFAIKESDNDTTVDLYPPVTQSWNGGSEQVSSVADRTYY